MIASKRFLLLTLVCTLSSVLTGQTLKAVPFDRLIPKNDVYYFLGKPYSGMSLEQYDSRKRKQILNWKNGILHGKRISYYQNGNTKDILYFNEGKRTDSFMFYDSKGTLREKGFYKNDLLNGIYRKYYPNGKLYIYSSYVEGEITGPFVLFYTNGQKESEAMMLKNKKEGKFTAWYEEGNKRKEAKYKGGKLDGRIVKYYPNGDTASIEHIKNDVREGEYKIWDLTLRTLIKQENYSKGKKNGSSISYGQTGDTVLMQTYNMGILHGEFRSFQNGNIESWGTYENGKKIGMWNEGWSSHYQQRKGNYSTGVMTGEWIFYDLEGKPLFCSIFNDQGEVTKTKKYRR